MDTGAAWSGRDHLPVFAERGVMEALALVGFARRLVQPHRVRRNLRQPHGLQIGEVREQPAGVIEHFGVVWIEAREPQRHVHGIRIPPEPRVDPLQVKAGHPAENAVLVL